MEIQLKQRPPALLVLWTLCITVVASVVLGLTAPPHALAQGSGTQDDPYIMNVYTTDTPNPFPDKISDQQIADGIAESQAKHGGKSAAYDSLQYKLELILKDGSVVPIYYNRGDMQADWMQKYYGQIKQVKFYLVMPKDDNAQTIMATSFWNDLRLKANVLSNDSSNTINENAPMTELKINGENVDPSMQYFKWNGNIKHNAYFEGTFDIPAEPPVWMRLISYPVLSGSGIPSTNMQVYGSTLIPRATFHYVLEKDYRKAAGLSATDTINQRSAGADWSSTAPEKALNVPEFKDPLVMSDFFDGRSFFFNSKGALAPYFSVGDTPSLNQEFTADGTEIVETTERPTYDEAKAASPLGYIYFTDDIDKPANPSDPESFDYTTEAGKGNYYFTPILHEDGTMGFDKHYYLIYRQLPTPVTIQKTDEAGKPLSGIKMDLYRIQDDTEELVAEGLTTDASGKIFATDKEEINQATLSNVAGDEAYNDALGFITRDGVTYLAPGTYKLKETWAPKEYTKTEKEFSVSAVQDLVSSVDETVSVQKVTFENKKAPTYPVRYTFSSKDGGTLPETVTQLLPQDTDRYYEGDIVTAVNPAQREVKVSDGTWSFVGYNPSYQLTVSADTLKDEELVFNGVWSFTKNNDLPKDPSMEPSKDSASPHKVPKQAKHEIPQTDDTLYSLTRAIPVVGVVGISALVIAFRLKKQRKA